MISLRELGNISRSHVGTSQVDEILAILDPGEQTHDRINFNQFYQKFVEFLERGDKASEDNMRVGEDSMRVGEQNNYNTNTDHLNLSPNMKNQGVFNENLRRSFEKNIISTPSSPYRTNGRKDSEQRNMRRKISQVSLKSFHNVLCL